MFGASSVVSTGAKSGLNSIANGVPTVYGGAVKKLAVGTGCLTNILHNEAERVSKKKATPRNVHHEAGRGDRRQAIPTN